MFPIPQGCTAIWPFMHIERGQHIPFSQALNTQIDQLICKKFVKMQ